MKINLLINNPGGVRSGYLNIDVMADGKDSRVRGDLANLNEHVEANEAWEIVAHGILDYFPMRAVDTILSHWISKLAHGGKLVISVLDMKELARKLVLNELTIQDFSLQAYGSQDESWKFRKSGFTLHQVCKALEAKGLRITTKRIVDGTPTLCVVGERP